MRTADSIEESKAQQEVSEDSSSRSEHQPKQRGENLIKFRWPKGVSGNPGGRPKKDFAAEFARKVLEAQGNEELLEQYATGFARQLVKGNAYTFKELAERGWGKLKETHEVTHRYEDVKDGDISERIDGILRDLGLARAVDEVGGTTGLNQGARSQSVEAQAVDVLSGDRAVKA